MPKPSCSVAGGGGGAPCGTTGVDGADAALEPNAFTARTVNVYDVPLTRRPTTIGLAVPEALAPPGDAVTTYDVTGAAFAAPGTKDTVAEESPAAATAPVGASGTVANDARLGV